MVIFLHEINLLKWHIKKRSSKGGRFLKQLPWPVTLKTSAAVRYQQLFGLDVSNLAFTCYLHHQFFNLPADRQVSSSSRPHIKKSPTCSNTRTLYATLTKFRSPSSDRTFSSKSLIANTQQTVCSSTLKLKDILLAVLKD